MKSITDLYDQKKLKENIPYYPHSLYVVPILLTVVIFLLIFVIKKLSMDHFQGVIDRLRNLERRLHSKDRESYPDEENKQSDGNSENIE